MIVALLDTNVLWPSLQRDFLLSLAAERAFRPLWSSAILAELTAAEEIKLVGRGVPERVARERAQLLVATMESVFEESSVRGWEPLEGTFGLPDPDDGHVLAALVVGGASTLVTHNVRDFPAASLPPGATLRTPADFAEHLVDSDSDAAARAVGAMAARSGRRGPRLSPEEVLDVLARRYGLHTVRDRLTSVSRAAPVAPPEPGTPSR